MPKGLKGDFVGLYRKFFDSLNFKHWYEQKKYEAEKKLESLQIILLCDYVRKIYILKKIISFLKINALNSWQTNYITVICLSYQKKIFAQKATFNYCLTKLRAQTDHVYPRNLFLKKGNFLNFCKASKKVHIY